MQKFDSNVVESRPESKLGRLYPGNQFSAEDAHFKGRLQIFY